MNVYIKDNVFRKHFLNNDLFLQVSKLRLSPRDAHFPWSDRRVSHWLCLPDHGCHLRTLLCNSSTFVRKQSVLWGQKESLAIACCSHFCCCLQHTEVSLFTKKQIIALCQQRLVEVTVSRDQIPWKSSIENHCI